MIATESHSRKHSHRGLRRLRRFAKRALYALALVLVGFLTVILWHGIETIRLTAW